MTSPAHSINTWMRTAGQPVHTHPQDQPRGARVSDIREIQAEVHAWVLHNFGNSNELATYGGLVEETGEVMQAAVKRSSGIRGTHDEWTAKIRKESADVFIKLCDIAQFEGFDLADAIADRWNDVKHRDWRANPIGHGIGAA